MSPITLSQELMAPFRPSGGPQAAGSCWCSTPACNIRAVHVECHTYTIFSKVSMPRSAPRPPSKWPGERPKLQAEAPRPSSASLRVHALSTQTFFERDIAVLGRERPNEIEHVTRAVTASNAGISDIYGRRPILDPCSWAVTPSSERSAILVSGTSGFGACCCVLWFSRRLTRVLLMVSLSWTCTAGAVPWDAQPKGASPVNSVGPEGPGWEGTRACIHSGSWSEPD